MNVYSFGMIEYWYDRSTRCWWAREVDANGDQVGEADHAYTRDEILGRVLNMEKDRRNRCDECGEQLEPNLHADGVCGTCHDRLAGH